ncbi:MAG: response regulator [Deltaproteobacteria bacterium]|nr:response regulator [Deltaproteobacteria bacterium]
MQNKAFQEYQSLDSHEPELFKILIVDDEPTIIETLRSFLQNLDIGQVTGADCGEEALEYVEQNQYDYIFIDLMMPGMNGIDLLKKIQPYHYPTNIIIMTGYPSMNAVIDSMHNGAADFLVKPFQFDDIKVVLKRLQRLRDLKEKNWALHQELGEKKKVEELNEQLGRRIHLQTILFNIVNSLSEMNQPNEIYRYLVDKAVESCIAEKACFMIYDREEAKLLVLSQKGLGLAPGVKADLTSGSNGKRMIDGVFIQSHFGKAFTGKIPLDKPYTFDGLISVPFNIRNEPFGVLLVADKKEGIPFDKEDEFILQFLSKKAALNIENMALYGNLKENLLASFMSLVSAIEAKDSYTQQHSSRVTDLSIKLAKKMRCSPEDIKRLELTGPLHDIGKIGIQDSILNKPGSLTDDEFAQIKTHPLIGVNIVSPLGLDKGEVAIIRNHHERWDGRGYPDGLSGEKIPRVSRILAVADAFDAMSSSRAYRQALPFIVCIHELERNSGTQFDPEVVKAALAVFKNEGYSSR